LGLSDWIAASSRKGRAAGGFPDALYAPDNTRNPAQGNLQAPAQAQVAGTLPQAKYLIRPRSFWKLGKMRSLDFWKIEPQVTAVVVLPEDKFTIAAGQRIPELIAITASLKNGSSYAKIHDLT
jgi:hypothetical protein